MSTCVNCFLQDDKGCLPRNPQSTDINSTSQGMWDTTGTFINARVQGTGQCWSRRIWTARAAKANFGLSPNHPCSSTGVINWGDQCRNLHAFPGLDLQKLTHFWIQRRSEPFKLASRPLAKSDQNPMCQNRGERW